MHLSFIWVGNSRFSHSLTCGSSERRADLWEHPLNSQNRSQAKIRPSGFRNPGGVVFGQRRFAPPCSSACAPVLKQCPPLLPPPDGLMFWVLPSFQKESFSPVIFHFSLDRACFPSAICYKLTILESGTGATLPSLPHFSPPALTSIPNL